MSPNKSRYFSPEPVFKRRTLSLEAIDPSAMNLVRATAVAAPSGHINMPSNDATVFIIERIEWSDTARAEP